jgi:hypothetical protein
MIYVLNMMFDDSFSEIDAEEAEADILRGAESTAL